MRRDLSDVLTLEQRSTRQRRDDLRGYQRSNFEEKYHGWGSTKIARMDWGQGMRFVGADLGKRRMVGECRLRRDGVDESKRWMSQHSLLSLAPNACLAYNVFAIVRICKNEFTFHAMKDISETWASRSLE